MCTSTRWRRVTNTLGYKQGCIVQEGGKGVGGGGGGGGEGSSNSATIAHLSWCYYNTSVGVTIAHLNQKAVGLLLFNYF